MIKRGNNGHKNLVVYCKSLDLAVEMYKHFSITKLNSTERVMINQLLRSCSSIGANIAEGYGRYYKKSYRHFLSISRGSSFETDYWLDLMSKTKIFEEKQLSKFIKKNNEITKILTTMMKKLQ